jgi:hypothetical protein
MKKLLLCSLLATGGHIAASELQSYVPHLAGASVGFGAAKLAALHANKFEKKIADGDESWETQGKAFGARALQGGLMLTAAAIAVQPFLWAFNPETPIKIDIADSQRGNAPAITTVKANTVDPRGCQGL